VAVSKTRGRMTDRAAIPTSSEVPAAGTSAGKEATPGKTAKSASAKRAPAAKGSAAAKQPGELPTQAAEVVAIVGPAARPASLPGGPVTVPKPTIAVVTLSRGGYRSPEPGKQHRVHLHRAGPQAPFTAKTITATVLCVEAPTKRSGLTGAAAVPTGTATATVGVKGNTPLSLVVTYRTRTS